MTHPKVNKIFITAIVCLYGFMSCSSDEVFYSYTPVSNNGWTKDTSFVFSPQLPDSSQLYNASFLLRYNNDYTYRNLWLFVEYNDSKGIARRDTVNCILSDKFGRWYGSGWGSLYQQEIPFLSRYRFATNQPRVKVSHGMRDDLILNIQEIGLKINKIKQ